MSFPYIGEIRLIAGDFAPEGYAVCNGQLLPISQHIALYCVLGNAYGGDGRSTFALPDLRSVVPMLYEAMTFVIALEGLFPPRA